LLATRPHATHHAAKVVCPQIHQYCYNIEGEWYMYERWAQNV